MRRLFYSLVLALGCIAFGSTAFAQAMSGTYTVNSAGGANFAHLGQAFDALETNGVSGPVTIEVFTGTGAYISDVSYSLNGPITGTSASNTVLVRAATGQAPVISGSGAQSAFGSYLGTIALNNLSWVTIEGLRVTGGSSYGLHVFTSGANGNVTFRRNIIYECPGIGIMGYGNSGPITNITFENNFIYDCQGGGSFGSFGGGGLIGFRRPNTNCVFRHNTLVKNSGTTGACIGLTGGGTYRLAECTNNIMYVTGSAFRVFQTDAGQESATLTNGNCIFFTGGAAFHSSATYPTYASWQTGGNDVNGMNADPMLVNVAPSSGDLHLTAASPCLHVAVGSTLTVDIDDEPRPNGPGNDIGADEFVPPGPTLSVAITAGTHELVAANEQGPGSNGIEAGRFTISSNNIASSSLQEIKLKADGTGNDATGLSLVAIYRDADASGAYSGSDSLVGSVPSFPSDNGIATITVATAEQGFGLAETRLYFVVVKMSGSGLGTDTFDFIIEDLTIPAQNYKVGVPSQPILGVQIDAPSLAVSAVAGTTQQVLRDAQGPGNNGIEVGLFSISSGQLAGGVLTAITILPSGTMDDAADFSQVAVYRETNTTAGYQSTDTLIETYTSFPSDNGARTFNVPAAQQTFPANESRSYYLVVRLSGNASITETFNSTVSDITTSATFKTGLPATQMNGLVIEGPTLTVAATAGSAQAVFADEQGPGGNGIHVGTFTIASDNFSNAVLDEIILLPSGSMDDSTDFSQVAIYRETNATPGYQVGDTLIQSHTTFPGDDTARTFTVPVAQATFAANETRTYYVVVKLSGNAVITTTFLSEVSDITVTGSLKAGIPSTAMNGLTIDRPTFILNDFTSTTQQTVSPGATDVVMQAFDVSYPDGPTESLTLLAARGTGSGNDAVDVISVRLVLDANGDRMLDAGDSVLSTQAYTLDNGLCSFDISGQAPFSPPETRSYLVVYDFDANATDQTTFACFIHVADASTAGTTFLGLPLPNTNGTPGAVINANRLLVNLVGPAAAQTVDSNDLGPTGDGLLLADVTIQAPPTHAWTLTDLTFVASGSGSHATAYSEIAVYDDNGNAVWDGAATDTLAAPAAVSFNAGTNDVTFTLTNAALGQGQTRRFLLVGKLNGTATSGQTFNARLEAMTATSALPGQVITLPTADSTALMIDDAVITVASGPKPPNVLRIAGQAAQLPLALFRFTATNDAVDVTSLTLTTAGTGDWINDMDPTTGIQLYLDDGDGAFSATSDALLGQAAGAASVVLTPTPALAVGNGSSEDVWVVVSLLASGGTGAAAAADTYTFSIAGTGDVSVTGTGPVTVLLSTAAPPTSATLSVIDFFVTDFQPPESLLAGGDVITMTGSGFIAPVTVRIDGVLCPGTAVISGGGTQLTGLMVPPRTSVGSGLAIEVTSGGLPAQVLGQTFRYTVKDEGGGSSSDDGSGCSGTGNTTWALLAGIAGLLAVVARRRRNLA